MAEVVPDVAEELFSEIVLGNTIEEADQIAVGTGTSTPNANDTSLDNEVYRTSKSDSNGSIQGASEPGAIQCRITISGGTEVAAGTDITEIGLFTANGTLLYRETFPAVTIDAGDRQTFEFTIDFENGS